MRAIFLICSYDEPYTELWTRDRFARDRGGGGLGEWEWEWGNQRGGDFGSDVRPDISKPHSFTWALKIETHSYTIQNYHLYIY